MAVNYAPLLNAPDIGQQFALGQQQGRELRLQGQRDNALQALSTNPNDEGAINALMAVDPRTALQYSQVNEARAAREAEVQRRQAFQGAYNPDTGQIDPARVRQAYAQTGDIEGAMKFDANQAAAQKSQLETVLKQVEIASQLLGSATDQASYTAALQRAAALGIDVSQEPQQYDPAYVQQQLTMGLSAKEKLEQQWKGLSFELERAKFGNQVTQQNIDNQFQAGQLGVAQANLGLRGAEFELSQIRALNEAGGALPARELRKETVGLRKEFENRQEVKDFKATIPIYAAALKAPNTPQGDLQIIYAVGKILDPGSVVREGELALTANATPLVQKLIGQANKQLGSGGTLTPETRRGLMEMLKSRVGAYRQGYDAARAQYIEYSQSLGAAPRAVVGDHAVNAYRGPQKPGAKQGGGTITVDIKGRPVR